MIFLRIFYITSQSILIILNFRQSTMDLKKYLILSGMLSLAYIAYSYLSKAPVAKGKKISLEVTKKILQEIKHQILIVCISFAEGITKNMNKKVPKEQEEQLMIYFRSEMVKIYEQKQELIIAKYNVNKVDYGQSLRKYMNDSVVSKNTNEIIDMMERAVKGQIPDLTVPKAASTKFNRGQMKQIYREMCLKIGLLVMNQLKKSKREDPTFDSKNDACFKKAIKEVSIYQFKVKFFIQKGIDPSWGCPNEIFFKIIESQKQKSPDFKAQMSAIEKGYQKIIQNVSNDPDGYKEPQLAALLDDRVLQIPSEIKPVSEIKPKLVVQPKPAVESKPAEDDEFDLDKLMAAELMSRSQEQQKQNKVQKEERAERERLALIEQRKNEIIEAERQIEQSLAHHQKELENAHEEERNAVYAVERNNNVEDQERLNQLHHENAERKRQIEIQQMRLAELKHVEEEIKAEQVQELEIQVHHTQQVQAHHAEQVKAHVEQVQALEPVQAHVEQVELKVEQVQADVQLQAHVEADQKQQFHEKHLEESVSGAVEHSSQEHKQEVKQQ